MTIDTQRLRELAQKATPGPWWAEVEKVKCSIRCYGSDEPTQITLWKPPAVGFAISDEQNEATASFIAQLNPENTLVLLDEIDISRGTIDIVSAALFAAEKELAELRPIKAAAMNLAKVKGRHNSEIAMNQLLDALK